MSLPKYEKTSMMLDNSAQQTVNHFSAKLMYRKRRDDKRPITYMVAHTTINNGQWHSIEQAYHQTPHNIEEYKIKRQCKKAIQNILADNNIQNTDNIELSETLNYVINTISMQSLDTNVDNHKTNIYADINLLLQHISKHYQSYNVVEFITGELPPPKSPLFSNNINVTKNFCTPSLDMQYMIDMYDTKINQYQNNASEKLLKTVENVITLLSNMKKDIDELSYYTHHYSQPEDDHAHYRTKQLYNELYYRPDEESFKRAQNIIDNYLNQYNIKLSQITNNIK